MNSTDHPEMAPKLVSRTDSRRPFNILFVLFFGLFAAGGLYVMRVAPALEKVPVNFDRIVASGVFENGLPLKQTYTGIGPVDFGLSFFVCAFLAGPAGWNDGVRLQQIYFFLSFFSVISIWNVEACRSRNRGRIISYTALFAIFYQTVGAAAIIPLFYLAYVLSSARDSYLLSGREVPLGHARALLPALVIGFLVPTLALYFPWDNLDLTQDLIALWQVSPVFPNLLLLVLAPLLSSPSPSSARTTTPPDVKYVKRVYLAASVVSTVAHLSTLYICFTSSSPQLSLRYVFLPSTTTWKDSTVLGLHYTFQWDFWGIFAPSLVWTWLVVMDTLRLLDAGPTLYDTVLTTFKLLVFSLLGGPGTAMALTWSWREDTMAMIEGGEKKSKKPKAA